jgi:hypothetical protein
VRARSNGCLRIAHCRVALCALEKMEMLDRCEVSAFYRALESHYNIKLVALRGVQEASKTLSTPIGNKGMALKNFGEDREFIEQLKRF